MLVVESEPVGATGSSPPGEREDPSGLFSGVWHGAAIGPRPMPDKPIKQICRELRVSRKTVRKVVRSGVTEFTYERRVQPQPKIGPWRSELDSLLAENAARPKRERLTQIRVFEELRALGYDGGYDAVRRYAAAWSKAETEASVAAYVPLSFDPGEAYQFDWSHEIVLIDGVTTTVKVAHVRLCYSRMVFVRAYPRESQEPRHRA